MKAPRDRMPPIHPGEMLLEDCMKPLDMTSADLAAVLQVPVAQVEDIVAERRDIDAEMALRLCRYFGGSARMWMALQASYDIKTAFLAVGEQIRKDVQPRPGAAEGLEFDDSDLEDESEIAAEGLPVVK